MFLFQVSSPMRQPQTATAGGVVLFRLYFEGRRW